MTIETDRLVAAAPKAEEQKADKAIRPKKLSEYIGQAAVKAQLSIFIDAALARQESLDHVLIFGPPGLGKTTLAHIIAAEMGGNLRQTSGPILEKAGDLAAILTTLQAGDVLFIDEIHRLNPVIEEILYPAMEDQELDLLIGEGPQARSIRLTLPSFTLVGATTRAGLLTSPLRDRFGIVARLSFYEEADLLKIVTRSARILSAEATEEGARQIAKRARGTPRIANRLLRRVRDFAQLKSGGKITAELADEALRLLEVDQAGFDRLDCGFLRALIEKFDGGPVGLDTLAAVIGEERGTIEEVLEPYLLQEGYIMRTPRGRVAMPKAYQHFGLPVKSIAGI